MDSFRNGPWTFDVVDSGPSDGPVVVLLHGFPEFADSWERVSSQLAAQGLRCVAPNQRGYSAGARPARRRDYRIPELVGDVAALVDALGQRRVHVVGHDWGAAVAWAFAAEHPDRVAGLTALSVPHPGAFLRAMVTSRQFLSSWYMYFFQLPWLPERLMLGPDGRHPAGLRRMMLAFGQSEALAERTSNTMLATGALRYALNWYRAMFLGDPRSNLVKVGVPSLFVYSDGDAAIRRGTADGCARWVTGPFRYEVLRGVSHWMLDEAPDDVARLVLEQVTRSR